MNDSSKRDSILRGLHVLDGGFASELEYLGASIDGPLWSARALEEVPDMVIAVHRAYIEAGAGCILTASYQISRMGYVEAGFAPSRADDALNRSIELARAACAEFPERRIVVAASLGPYGAALHNGAEYHGDYECSFDSLVRFHRERIAALAESEYSADILAFETLPSLEEALAIAQALDTWPDLAAWFSFTCRDGRHVAHGEPLSECANAMAVLPQTAAIGINCTAPGLILSLIKELRRVSNKPILVYPNSGEGWDAAARSWTGAADAAGYGAMAARWFAAGAQIVGGCCRTRPEHIREVAAAAKALRHFRNT